MTGYALLESTDTGGRTEQASWFGIDEHPSRPANAVLRTPKFVTPNRVQTSDLDESSFVRGCVFISTPANEYFDRSLILRILDSNRVFQSAQRERGIYASSTEYFGSSESRETFLSSRAFQPTDHEQGFVIVHDEPDSNLTSDDSLSTTLSSMFGPVVAVQSDVLNVSPYPAVDPLNIDLQIAGMRHLEDGWADGMQSAETWGRGYGKALSAEGLDWIAGQFDFHYAQYLPRPFLYPTPEGGIQAEWSIGPYEASIEIDILQHIGYWHCFDIENNTSTERNFDLDQADSWHWIAHEITRLERNPE